MTQLLSNICDYINEKIAVNDLSDENYISTENMLPNKSGIVKASTLPNLQLTPAYQENDVLISNIRPYFRKIWQAEYCGGCSNDVLVLRAKKSVNPKFLYYVLSEDKFFDYATATSKGTKMPRGDKTAIMKYEVPEFSETEQEKIANILFPIDEKIAINSATNNNLEQQAMALFKSWFIDFEPFDGTMPNDWEIKTLDEFCNIFTGRKNANENDENGKNKFFTCGPKPLLINSYIHDGPAIIIAGNGAYTGRTRFYDGKFDLYQRTYACISLENINKDYIYLLYIIIKNVLQKNIMGGTHGSAVPYIVINDIAKFEITFKKDIFDNLSSIIKPFINKILENEIENEKLIQLRDTLLPKLMSGEIDVDKVEV